MRIQFAVFNEALRTPTRSGILDYHYTEEEARVALAHWPAGSVVVRLDVLKRRYAKAARNA